MADPRPAGLRAVAAPDKVVLVNELGDSVLSVTAELADALAAILPECAELARILGQASRAEQFKTTLRGPSLHRIQ